ncbi:MULTISPECIES: hypothetical protein [Flavobacterium]|uniref:hypothetical protein n=1 Tax=Flavobacterium TaxID=237 RepID=UPI0018E78744|nr:MULTISPECIES: hypothetical protein [Flavobacterium]MBJ2126152.1 hypothetical protein [Flavobacterium sp. IB48]
MTYSSLTDTPIESTANQTTLKPYTIALSDFFLATQVTDFLSKVTTQTTPC